MVPDSALVLLTPSLNNADFRSLYLSREGTRVCLKKHVDSW